MWGAATPTSQDLTPPVPGGVDVTNSSASARRESSPEPRGSRKFDLAGNYVIVPLAAFSVPGMSDAAFRAWAALDILAWGGRCPSNSQIAAACGWSVPKAKRILREL